MYYKLEMFLHVGVNENMILTSDTISKMENRIVIKVCADNF